VVERATGRQVCLAFAAALVRYGIPDEALTDIQTRWCPEVPGSSGRRCEDRGVRHPFIVVA